MRPFVEGRPLGENCLVERAKNGDVEAFTALIRIHQSMALRVASLVLGNTAEAEDAVQEAFVKAFGALGRFRAGAEFRPWILRIVRNEALNRRRGSVRRAGLALRAASDPVSGDAAPSPETEVIACEARARLLAAVEALPDRLREVVQYRYLIGLSEAETALALQIPAGTVKSRTARAIARLRQTLGDADG
jgi:RNA polymerase sigma-70 factor (ECF subfamily)